ncbi:Hpt domain-containing protein [Vibrio sp. CAU 1672]|uniref:Hpt domain-containing protein n=1 Tax=Vibrio sp. CAU 1672 TaxID=3032594 RepID=UPI0023DC3E73|nr:Hpt domain-containing protein [Vibrio sp. CAU 1672]MDF2153849.1 Hpt domain-containing protein [Vibrio sp. CAU 1672]
MKQGQGGFTRAFGVFLTLWLLAVAGLWQQARHTFQIMHTVEALSSEVDEVRSGLRFNLPLRIRHLDQVSLKLQLVYAVRLQLETESNGGWFAPDITQLLFTTDRFLEDAHTFIGNDSELVSLANLIHQRRRVFAEMQHELVDMHYRLGALVLEAMFSDAASIADVYRGMDDLFTQSLLLPQPEQAEFQKLLANTSTVLSGRAQSGNLAERLLNPDLPHQLMQVKSNLQRNLFVLMLLLTTCGVLVWLVLGWWLYVKKRTAENAPVTAAKPVEALQPEGSSPETEPRQGEQKDNKTQPNPAGAGMAEIATDAVFIDIRQMLDSLSDDHDSVRMLLELFIDDHAGDVAELQRLLSEDREHAQRLVHSLKGVSGSLSAMPLHNVAAEVESLLKHGKDISPQKLGELRDILQQTTQYAADVLRSKQLLVH